MRKNRMMRAASALMVAVLLTTSTISGTFAKYVTTNTATDTARVAKWGVELQVVGNLFGDTYANKAGGNKITNDTDVNATVQSYNIVNGIAADDVVAPGTENTEGFTFSINGKPEVSGQISIDTLEVQNIYLKEGTYGVMVPVEADAVTSITFDEFDEKTFYKIDGDNYVLAEAADADAPGITLYTLEDVVTLKVNDDIDNEDYYYPVIFKLVGKNPLGDEEAESTLKDGTCKEDSLIRVADKLAELFETSSLDKNIDAGETKYNFAVEDVIEFDHNTLLSNLHLGNVVLTWSWAFENGANDAEKKMFNGADTILGNLMAIDLGAYVNEIKVVKLTDLADTYTELDAAADANLNDYCLNLKFNLAITVEQVD